MLVVTLDKLINNVINAPLKSAAGEWLSIRKYLLRPHIKRAASMNRIQERYLRFIESLKFKNFDGEQVANDLVTHANYWRSALMLPGSMLPVPLWDLEWEIYESGTLYILVGEGKENALKALSSKWNADEVYWVEESYGAPLLGREASKIEAKRYILRLWWG